MFKHSPDDSVDASDFVSDLPCTLETPSILRKLQNYKIVNNKST